MWLLVTVWLKRLSFVKIISIKHLFIPAYHFHLKLCCCWSLLFLKRRSSDPRRHCVRVLYIMSCLPKHLGIIGVKLGFDIHRFSSRFHSKPKKTSTYLNVKLTNLMCPYPGALFGPPISVLQWWGRVSLFEILFLR